MASSTFNFGGLQKKLLATYDNVAVATNQNPFKFVVPKDYKYLYITYPSYSSEKVLFGMVIDVKKLNEYFPDTQPITIYCMSTWDGTASSVLRARNIRYNSKTRELYVGNAGRFDNYKWAPDNRVCPVKEIWGVN